MSAISQEFAPPFKLISPFFIFGGVFYVLTAFFLFFFGVDELSFLNPKVISFTHLFLLGFVMMTIFGAMAQLVPVVLEVGHFGVELFYAIWPLLLIGTLLMAFGFIYSPALLPFGGMTVLIAMMIFVGEIFLTIKKVEKFNVVMSSILLANTFLFFGVIFGLVMALGYAGTIVVDITALLKAHVYLVVGGYLSITIMGLSVVLIPMFGLSHGFSLKPLHRALYMMSASVLLVVFSSIFDISVIDKIGYVLSIFSLLIYFYQVYTIYKTRARKENDTYAISLMFSFISLVVSLGLGFLSMFVEYEPILIASAWLMFFGFFGFAITGHIYKIIPFLVWYERFSPLVGKEKVPMLNDMLPMKSSHAQIVFTGVGIILITVAILTQNNQLIGAGASFMVVGAFALLRSILYMINFR
jgi:hypothetical protein